MQIAEKYGRSPEEVENWDEYWFSRAAVALEGECLNDRRRTKEMNSKR